MLLRTSVWVTCAEGPDAEVDEARTHSHGFGLCFGVVGLHGCY